ncbi:hypothetical protein PRZ48_015007 [Zasmidium cellare]|uniref:Protein kinase domain-containing protein n=1 Tax=Zasmidium cellare TaxID=395010 RepID=A0ABR0DXG5_ZASCE|nr:hypothetical protein PRZ48_015007 [Zasmidium cellare]
MSGSESLLGQRRVFAPSSLRTQTETTVQPTYGNFEAFGTAKNFYDNVDGTADRHQPNVILLLSLLGSIGVKIWSTDDLNYEGERDEASQDVASGAFKTVRFATHNRQAVAVKTMRQERTLRTGDEHADQESTKAYHTLIRDILMEIRVMSHAAISRHPNVVSLVALAFEEIPDWTQRIDFFRPILLVDPSDKTYPDLRRLLSAADLETLLNDEMIISLIGDIADGMAALHTFGLVHADLKPDNVLLYNVDNRYVAKISDFGLSGVLQSLDSARGGDRAWLPPDRLLSKSADPTQAGDVYSFGLVVAAIFQRSQHPWPDHLNGIELDELRLSAEDRVPLCLINAMDRSRNELTTTFERFEDVVAATTSYHPTERLDNLAIPVQTDIFDILQVGKLSQLLNFRYSLPKSVREVCFTQGYSDLREIDDSQVEHHYALIAMANLRRHPTDDVLEKENFAPLRRKLDGIENIGIYTLKVVTQAMNANLALPRHSRRPSNFASRGRGRGGPQYTTFVNCTHSKNKGSGSALCKAVQKDDIAAIKRIFRTAKDPAALANETVGPCALPILMFASMHSLSTICKVLLEHGADINALPNERCRNRTNALFVARSAYTTSQLLAWDCSQLLHKPCQVCGGADECRINLWQRYTQALDATVAHQFATFRKLARSLDLILSYDSALASSRTSDGKTPLDKACRYRNYEAVKVLLAHGADVNATDMQGVGPLAKAFSGSIGGTGQAIIQPQLCLEEAASFGYNFDQACKLVAKLIVNGADVDAIDSKLYSPECYAFRPTFARAPLGQLCHDSRGTPPSLWAAASCTHMSLGTLDYYGRALLPTTEATSCSHLFKGVLPNPSDLELICILSRTAEAENFDFVVECEMLPPNLAHNTRKSLFRRTLNLFELLPEPSVGYHIFMGMVPLKHKADVLVSFQAERTERSKSGLVVWSSEFRYYSQQYESVRDPPKAVAETHMFQTVSSLRLPLLSAPPEPGQWWIDPHEGSESIVEGTLTFEDAVQQIKDLYRAEWGDDWIAALELKGRDIARTGLLEMDDEHEGDVFTLNEMAEQIHQLIGDDEVEKPESMWKRGLRRITGRS